MRPPRLPSSRLFQTPPFTVVLAVLASAVLMFYAAAGRNIVLASNRLGIEREVYRTLIDSLYTTTVDSGAPALRELYLYDHFSGPYIVGDSSIPKSIDEWLRNSIPGLPADARPDFRHWSADTSSLVAAMLAPGAAADTEAGLPFPGTRAHLHLLADSTLSAQAVDRADGVDFMRPSPTRRELYPFRELA